MAALLAGMSAMAVMLGVVLPVWHTAMRREREAELVFRGEQYVHAIEMYQRRYAGTYPPNLDVLLEQRFLRRRYEDPITRRDFQLLYIGTETAGQPVAGTAVPRLRGGIAGVVSTSTETSLRTYKGRTRYNEWAFVATQPGPRAGTMARPRDGTHPRGAAPAGSRPTPPLQPPGRARPSRPR